MERKKICYVHLCPFGYNVYSYSLLWHVYHTYYVVCGNVYEDTFIYLFFCLHWCYSPESLVSELSVIFFTIRIQKEKYAVYDSIQTVVANGADGWYIIDRLVFSLLRMRWRCIASSRQIQFYCLRVFVLVYVSTLYYINYTWHKIISQ